MNERQRLIVHAPRWIMYPMILIGFGAFALDVIGDNTASNSHLMAIGDTLSTFDPAALVVLLVFWLVLAAMFVEFIHHEISDALSYRAAGRPILELRRSRLITLLVLVPIAAAFVLAMDLYVLVPDALPYTVDRPDLMGWMVFAFFCALGHFVLIAFLTRAIRNRPVFVATDQGFLWEPGDLSMGFIRWMDVAGITESELIVGGVGVNNAGATTRRMLVVSLRDPERYADRFTAPIQWLKTLSSKFVRWQIERAGDVVIDPADLGGRYSDVRAVMVEKVRQAGGKVEFVQG